MQEQGADRLKVRYEVEYCVLPPHTRFETKPEANAYNARKALAGTCPDHLVRPRICRTAALIGQRYFARHGELQPRSWHARVTTSKSEGRNL
jgi:hypothetical protein